MEGAFGPSCLPAYLEILRELRGLSGFRTFVLPPMKHMGKHSGRLQGEIVVS